MDLRQSPKYAKFMEEMGWIVERNEKVNYFIKKLPIIGSFIKIQRPEKLDLKYTKALQKIHKAFQTVIEPALSYQNKPFSHIKSFNSYFKPYKFPFLPSKTILIDLNKNEDVLLKEMHSKTRYNIKIALKNKIEVKKSKDIEIFINFWHTCHQKRLIILNQKNQIRKIYETFEKDADILFAYKNQVFVAALLLLHHNPTSYYMYAAANKKGKSMFAPTLITWEGIKLAKNRGSKIFDFEGIYDDRFPIKSWVGFTRFKKGFGGEEIVYPGTFIKNSFPFTN